MRSGTITKFMPFGCLAGARLSPGIAQESQTPVPYLSRRDRRSRDRAVEIGGGGGS